MSIQNTSMPSSVSMVRQAWFIPGTSQQLTYTYRVKLCQSRTLPSSMPSSVSIARQAQLIPGTSRYSSPIHRGYDYVNLEHFHALLCVHGQVGVVYPRHVPVAHLYIQGKIMSIQSTSTPSSVSMARQAWSIPGTSRQLTYTYRVNVSVPRRLFFTALQ